MKDHPALLLDTKKSLKIPKGEIRRRTDNTMAK